MARPGEFEVLEVIGRGSFGQIRKVRRISDGEILARKEISYKSMNQKEKAQLIAEFRILKSLVHPNIVQYLYHEHLAEEHVVHLYMEYCGGGDLAGLIRECQSSGTIVPENVVWSIFSQLILALYRCHYNVDPPPVPNDLFGSDSDISPPPNPSTVILHRDIKPDNVFLDANHSVRLGDFGLAKMLDQEHLFARTYVGTPYYMSPEVLMDQPSTTQSDIWSLGCVIYELCALHPPFQAKTHLILSQKIREGDFSPIPTCYSSTLSKTITACLNVNPLQRPTTATLLRLDVIKLCRKERDLINRENSLIVIEEQLKRHEQILLEREQQLIQQVEMERHQMEQEIYNRLEGELAGAIENEVERRLEIALKSASAATSTTGSVVSITTSTSPADATITIVSATATPSSEVTLPSTSPGRNVRGPRSIRDTIISPLRDMSNNQYYNNIMNGSSTSTSEIGDNSNELSNSGSSTSSSSSFISMSTSTSISSNSSSGPTSNWITSKKEKQRAAPHYQAMHSPGGIGAAAARARLLGVKGPSGSIGRAAVQLQRENQETAKVWDESIHGDNMPSPFLRRWERKTVI